MEARILAMYLGCPVMAVTSKLGEHKRKLVGVFSESDDYQSAKLWFAGGISDWDFDDFKPILRPLSSMTEEEAKELFKVFWGERGHADPLEIVWTENKNYLSITYSRQEPIDDYDKKRYDLVIMSLCLMEDFSMLNHWDYRRGNSTSATYQPIYNSHKMTAYLLSKGFDLFGLIEKGDAIDQSKLEEK